VRSTTLIALAALGGLLCSVPLLAPEAQAQDLPNRPDILDVPQLRHGMKGYGLTVFEGTRPEKFDVEIIDILKNFRPRHDLILIKTMHPRLEVAKVVAGMSGSPIFINGKMIGAYAYGWTFGKEPVAGVTPIRTMLDDLERPLPKEIDALGGRIRALQARLGDPSFYSRDPKAFAEATAALAAAQSRLAAAEERWLELELLREEIAGG